VNCSSPKIKFVEFSPELATVCKFYSTITVNNINYILMAMVRHLNSHFTCAVMKGNNWFFVDDMQQNIQSFENIEGLYQTYPSKWFFAVYVKNDFDRQELISEHYFCRSGFDNAYDQNLINEHAKSFLEKRKLEKDLLD